MSFDGSAREFVNKIVDIIPGITCDQLRSLLKLIFPDISWEPVISELETERAATAVAQSSVDADELNRILDSVFSVMRSVAGSLPGQQPDQTTQIVNVIETIKQAFELPEMTQIMHLAKQMADKIRSAQPQVPLVPLSVATVPSTVTSEPPFTASSTQTMAVLPVMPKPPVSTPATQKMASLPTLEPGSSAAATSYKPILSIRSDVDPNVIYFVDPVDRTCTCDDYRYRQHDCKHILKACATSSAPVPSTAPVVAAPVASTARQVASSSAPGVFYTVDSVANTCTCPDFTFRAPSIQGYKCKHLKAQ